MQDAAGGGRGGGVVTKAGRGYARGEGGMATAGSNLVPSAISVAQQLIQKVHLKITVISFLTFSLVRLQTSKHRPVIGPNHII